MDNENIKKAQKKLEDLNNDEQARFYAEYVKDARRNEISALAAARLEGETQGKIEGRLEGEILGETKSKTQIIKKMLAKNMNIETISELTDVSIQEILDIKNNK